MKSIIRKDLRNDYSFSTDDGILIDNDIVYESRYINEDTFQVFINNEWRTIEGVDFEIKFAN